MVKAGKARAAEEVVSGTESVRERILSTARELFYKEGVRSVGVDTVVAQSGVAKTSLYRWFPSKDALIVAVLEQEAKDRWAGWDKNAQNNGSEPRARLRAHFTGIARYVSSPHFRGCPFMNVIAEFADRQHPARGFARTELEQVRSRGGGVVDNIPGVRDPVELTEQLVLLVEGSFASGQGFGKEGPQQFLVAAAEGMVKAQLKR